MTVDEPSLSRHDSASSKVDFDHRSTRLQKLTSSVRDQFTQEARGRILENPDQVFEQNAWDHVEWDPEQYQRALEIVEKQKSFTMPGEKQLDLDQHANEYWNKFYECHEHRFFKDRNWFAIEFPELFQRPTYLQDQDSFRILEVGCGAGNTVFPVLRHHQHDPRTWMYACDFSSVAVDIVKSQPEFDPERCQCFVHDLADAEMPFDPIQPESIDVIVLVFVLSALNPSTYEAAFRKLARLLRPGGLILFRDYGRYDMTQLRFKMGSLITENFYARGDGTQVYYTTQEELQLLAENAGLIVEQNAIDRRLIVNRLRKLKMYRIWIQGKFRKPLLEE